MKPTRLAGFGAMDEIGKAQIMIEHEEEIVLIDCGIKFADDWLSGVEGIIPDFTYLKEKQHKIKGLFITHGHLDHIGGVPYLLKMVKIPVIYCSKIGIAFIKGMLKEHNIPENITEFIEIEKDMNIKFDKMEVDFWTVQHSIPDAFGIRVRTPNGTIADTGDFRFDYTPIGNLTDFTKLEKIGNEGLTLLMSDATNAMRPSHSPSELQILTDIEKFILEGKKKVIVTAFASNLTRVQAVIELAIKHKKKILAFGRSMVKGIETAKKLGYLTVEESNFIDKKNYSKYNENEVLILTTGSQGEELAALNRMAIGKHPQVTLKQGDLIIFSSSPIPGNRMKIEQLTNKLYKLGAIIKENGVDGYLHTSGHAYIEEHEKIFEIAKPKFFIPYHGQFRMGVAHIATAHRMGIAKENTFQGANGDVFEMLNENVIKTNEKIDVGPIYIDGNIADRTTSKVIKERERLGQSGFVVVALAINKENNTIHGKPRIISRGTLFVKNSLDLINEVQRIVHGAVLYTIKNKQNWTSQDLKKIITERLEPFFYKVKRRSPIILPTIMITNSNPKWYQNKKNNTKISKI